MYFLYKLHEEVLSFFCLLQR